LEDIRPHQGLQRPLFQVFHLKILDQAHFVPLLHQAKPELDIFDGSLGIFARAEPASGLKGFLPNGPAPGPECYRLGLGSLMYMVLQQALERREKVRAAGIIVVRTKQRRQFRLLVKLLTNNTNGVRGNHYVSVYEYEDLTEGMLCPEIPRARRAMSFLYAKIARSMTLRYLPDISRRPIVDKNQLAPFHSPWLQCGKALFELG
jgi:hypothetical protein